MYSNPLVVEQNIPNSRYSTGVGSKLRSVVFACSTVARTRSRKQIKDTRLFHLADSCPKSAIKFLIRFSTNGVRKGLHFFSSNSRRKILFRATQILLISLHRFKFIVSRVNNKQSISRINPLFWNFMRVRIIFGNCMKRFVEILQCGLKSVCILFSFHVREYNFAFWRD